MHSRHYRTTRHRVVDLTELASACAARMVARPSHSRALAPWETGRLAGHTCGTFHRKSIAINNLCLNDDFLTLKRRGLALLIKTGTLGSHIALLVSCWHGLPSRTH